MRFAESSLGNVTVHTNKYNSCTIYLVFELVLIMQYLVNTIGTEVSTSVFGKSKKVVVWIIWETKIKELKC